MTTSNYHSTSFLPPHIQPLPAPSAGTGLFTTKSIAAGELIFKIQRPLITVLDSARLTDTCEWCLRTLSEGGGDAGDGGGEEGLKLRACTGCKVVRYCSKACQSASWTDPLTPHRPLCPLYKRLYPNVLPNTVRAAIRILLLSAKAKKNDPSSNTELSAFLALQSHLSDFRAQHAQGQKNGDGLSTWQTIELMAQAAKGYSGSEMELAEVQEVVARILTNTHTLTTPTLHPLGLSLSPSTARLNHSCAPNAYLTFSSTTLSIRTLLPISASPTTPTELTISYIDSTMPLTLRQHELSTRYFFTCTCPLCTFQQPQPINPSHSKKAEEANALLTKAKTSSNPAEAIFYLESAKSLLNGQPADDYPHPAVQHQILLAALAMQDWTLALCTAILTHENLDPVLFPQEHHPVRVVHSWVLLRLLVQVAEARVERFEGVRWELVIWKFWKEVRSVVGKSHGAGTVFEKEIDGFGQGVVEGLRALEGSQGGRAREMMEREWGLLVELVAAS